MKPNLTLNVSDHPTQQMLVDTLSLMDHLITCRKLTTTQENLVNKICKTCYDAL